MFVEGRDFGCADEGGIYFCWPRTPEVEQVYRQLQHQLREVGVPTPDTGKITPATVVAVQQVLVTLNKTAPLPADVRPIVTTPNAVRAIQLTAEAAKNIMVYVSYVLARHPRALVDPPIPTLQAAAPRPFPIKPVLYTLGSAVLLAGIGAAVRHTGIRSSGVGDSSHFLPESDDPDDDG